MIETGDYIAIRFQDEARNKKPVGIYWIQAAVVKTAGALGLRNPFRFNFDALLRGDPEARALPSGQALTKFSLAVNRAYTTKEGEKIALTDIAFQMVTVQAPVPAQPAVPDQPAKLEPGSAAGVSVTAVPAR